jgi:serine/threonine protein kinase
MTEAWTRWEGEIINGVFPLRRFLGGSDHSGVFLTHHAAQNLPDAAVKLVAAIPTLTEAQLSHWRTAASLSHPHLIRLLDSGRCQLGELQFLFVVMEYAEQNLAQILPRRALTADEVREMLPPILDTLGFLHRKNLLQGQLKPSNILVVNDQLKLASDTVRPAGESRTSIAQASVYDPPEARDGSFSAAGDIWSLGVTVVEALTQYPPAWPDEASDAVSLPATLPPTFVGIVRRCLNLSAADRPTVADLEAPLKPSPQASAASVSQPDVPPPEPLASKAPYPASPPRESPKQRLFVLAITVILIVLIAIWAGVNVFHRHPNSQQAASSSSRASSQQSSLPAADSQNPGTAPPAVPATSSNANSASSRPAPSRPASRLSDQRAQRTESASPSVLHEEIPEVPRRARETIRGHIWVAVRVTVAPSGEVVGETLEVPGPSKYFAHLATEAARKWKFAPAGNQPSRKWLLRFEFTRDGTTVRATSPWS